MESSAWLSDAAPLPNQGMSGLGSFSPAATRFLYSSVFSHAFTVREM